MNQHVVLNHSPVLPLNRTALWDLSYRFSMARKMLALMLYFLIIAYKASCHTLSKAFLKSMKTCKRFCWCCRYFSCIVYQESLAAKICCSMSLIGCSSLNVKISVIGLGELNNRFPHFPSGAPGLLNKGTIYSNTVITYLQNLHNKIMSLFFTGWPEDIIYIGRG